MRNDFGAFCEEALPHLGIYQKPAAHQRLLIRELQAAAEGGADRLMVFMPPGSAKSTYVSKLFPPWFLSRKPNASIIGASNTADLANSFSKNVQNVIRSNDKALGYNLANESQELWHTNQGGQYRSAGAGGTITGFRADLFVIDDPIKGREDADSPVMRDKIWNWYLTEVRTRVKPGTIIVLVQTRWHEDDLAGRLLSNSNDWRVVKLAATAGDDDPLGRKPGEMLWSDDPQYAYGEEIARIKEEYEKVHAMRDWYSLFEQDPRPAEGGLFEVAKIAITDTIPEGQSARGWDLAATEQHGTRNPDWTAGVRMVRTAEGRFVVTDVTRLRGAPDAVERALVNTAAQDTVKVRVGLPQDPGQAGKGQVLYLTRKLAGYAVVSSPETGDKATRAAPFISQVNAGNVSLLRGTWNAAYLDELRGFPGGAKDDQVDASSRAFSMLVAPPAPMRRKFLPWMGR